MTGPTRPDGVRPVVALALATVSFVALLIAGLGMLSLALDQDVIAVRGLGQVPGILGTALAVAAFAAALWAAIRRRPTYLGALGCAVAAFLAYVAGVWLGAAFSGADLGAAAAAAGGVAASGFGVVVAAAGLVAGWGGVALVRTRSDRPRWPWEDPFDE
ncbi:hypothetical protein [Microbacterium sp. RU33B]|uniref:hypothetical protein n=1 Tax=Microbacterium sp. RU33B TaxID=1907390 RepID=UPI0009638E6D|nr:hypothetical protein [Microbacterium sp. RU33B]SIT87454.1 hypothetical protein SAMN05880545_2768 [Microbacterium sp. RU33B]